MPSLLRAAAMLACVVGHAMGCGHRSLADDGPPKQPVDVAAVLKTVEDGDRGEKLAALGRLRQAAIQDQLGDHKKNVIKQCTELMQRKDSDLAEAACGVLSWLDAEAVQPLVEALQSKDLRVRSDAARLISSIVSRHPSQVGKMDAAIPHLAKLLDGKPDAANTARHNAFYAISQLGPRAIPHMIAALNAEEYFQWVMMKGFVRHGEKSIEPLCKALRTGDVTTGRNAAFMLFHISWRAPDVLPVLEEKALGPLTEAIGDDDQLVRSTAIDTLGRMERRAKPALEKIIGALDQPDAPFASIADAARRIGPEVKHLGALLEGAERMTAAATSANDRQRARGAFGPAIAAIGEAGVKGVIRALDDRREEVRQTAMWALFYLGPKAAPAVSAVIRKLNDGDELAPPVLGAIGPKAEAAIPHLIRRLEQDEWAQPRSMFGLIHHSPSAEALAAIGRSAVSALLEGLKHKDDLVKAGCLIALVKMDPKAMVSLSAIEPLCRHERPIIRVTAMRALVQFGLAKERLKPILERMQVDAHPGVAHAAKKELTRLLASKD
jgi:HEAT repeat protein